MIYEDKLQTTYGNVISCFHNNLWKSNKLCRTKSCSVNGEIKHCSKVPDRYSGEGLTRKVNTLTPKSVRE